MPRRSKLDVHPTALVLRALKKAHKPLSAYELLERMRPHGIKAPPVVYRALDELMEKGSVHKIRELAAFVACDCAKDHHHAVSVLTVCGTCHAVAELHDHGVIHPFEALRKKGIALRDHAVIELPITCAACTA